MIAAGISYMLEKNQKTQKETKFIFKDEYNNKLSFHTAIYGWSIGGIIITALLLIVAVPFINGCIYHNVQQIKSLSSKIQIYEDKRNTLVAQYSLLLDSNYAGYESYVYDKIVTAVKTTNNNSVSTNINVIPQWPTPRYSETLKTLVDKIDELNSSIYECKLQQQDLIASCRSRRSGVIVPNIFIYDYTKYLTE